MNKTIFVISDLHLGGKPGFQMCSLEGQEKLAEFVRWAGKQKTDKNDVNLVLAGDIVDFLAEEPYEVFAVTDKGAESKLAQIIEHTKGVWEAFQDYIRSGGQLTVMLGNHDIELSLPLARRLLLKTLGAGQIDFIYDNQAFIDGTVIIEHGNRYDKWNSVPHNLLRQLRSAISRKERFSEIPQIPGSLLVANIMNKIKEDFSFVDLLKPETEAVIPLIGVLSPKNLKYIPQAIWYLRSSKQSSYDVWGLPKDPENASATVSTSENVDLDYEKAQERLRQARELAACKAVETTIDPEQASSIEIAKASSNSAKAVYADKVSKDKQGQIDKLYQALLTFVADQNLTFSISNEKEEYLRPAIRLAEDFEVIVFGHTHLAKYIPLRDTLKPNRPLLEHLNVYIDKISPCAVYLNSGTWADLMQLPNSLLKGDEAKAKKDLSIFIDDLLNDNLENWRKPKPTYVRIDIDKNGIAQAKVLLFESKFKAEEPIS